jgi:hypothetical protein
MRVLWSKNYRIAGYSDNEMLWDDPPSRLRRYGEAGSCELAA